MANESAKGARVYVTNASDGGVAGTVTVGAQADGVDVTQGITTGAAVVTNANGTLQQYLRGLVVEGASNGQYAGVPSTFSIQSADATVFTLAAGEVGFIQNLSADAPLAVKLGASASTTSLNRILNKSTSASDGTGGVWEIRNWVGAVSVAKMTGTASYLAWKQARA